jgi:hypothetical protein
MDHFIAGPMKKFGNAVAVLAVLLPVWTTAEAGTASTGYDPQTVQAIAVTRQGLADTVAYLDARRHLFPPDGQGEADFPGRNGRLALWQDWQGFLDRILALDRLAGETFAAYRAADGDARKAAFRVAYAAFLAQYREALDFIAVAERNPAMHTVLNEVVPELGLPERTYARLKYRFLNVLRGAEFARLDVIYSLYGADPELPLTPGLEADRQALWQAGQGAGPKLTAENALRIVQDAALASWFPVQKNVSEWMGDTRVWRPQTSLISQTQLAELQPQLKPGDVLLVRREWFLSNVGLPGFWPHAALYVGTPAERAAFFDDPAVRAWVRAAGEDSGDLEALLHKRSPQAAQTAGAPFEDGHVPRVVEAISEGVSFTSLEHAGGGDSLVVLRPRLPKTARARAIVRAFHYAGRPYDFDFDFRTDASLVCTELVAKAYEGDDDLPGLSFPVVEVLGRPVTPANLIARQFDEDFGGAHQQFDLVAFLDGQEAAGNAVPAGLDAFRRSWRRPKWHVLVQNTPFANE